jgi:hypothetical protein
MYWDWMRSHHNTKEPKKFTASVKYWIVDLVLYTKPEDLYRRHAKALSEGVRHSDAK